MSATTTMQALRLAAGELPIPGGISQVSRQELPEISESFASHGPMYRFRNHDGTDAVITGTIKDATGRPLWMSPTEARNYCRENVDPNSAPLRPQEWFALNQSIAISANAVLGEHMLLVSVIFPYYPFVYHAGNEKDLVTGRQWYSAGTHSINTGDPGMGFLICIKRQVIVPH